jgi:hypothetical protein
LLRLPGSECEIAIDTEVQLGFRRNAEVLALGDDLRASSSGSTGDCADCSAFCAASDGSDQSSCQCAAADILARALICAQSAVLVATGCGGVVRINAEALPVHRY